jgi:1-deoxyxylulose-5-phosphate synthase
MKLNHLGKSDLHISEIGFGCMSLPLNQAESNNLLHRALELGINFFDTADLYQNGENEKIVGHAFKGMREKIILASKVGNRWNEDGKTWRWDPSPTWIKEEIHHTLKRLQTPYLDLYQLHGGTLEDPIDDIIATFEEFKKQGLIRHYGISSIRPNVIHEYVKRSNISSVMMQYSLLDRRPEEEALELLQQNNISVIARGSLAKGLLSSKPTAAFQDYSQEEVAKIREGLEPFVTPKRSKAQLALRYALSHPAVTTTIPGASRQSQLEENTRNVPALTMQELEQLRSITKTNVYELHR